MSTKIEKLAEMIIRMVQNLIDQRKMMPKGNLVYMTDKIIPAIQAAIDERWQDELKGVLVKLDKLQQKVEALEKQLDGHLHPGYHDVSDLYEGDDSDT